MINASRSIAEALVSPVRDIHARVELYEGSTLIETCSCSDKLINFTVERIGDESRFFGFGICQRLNVHFIDKNRKLNVSTANSMIIAYEINGEVVYPYPTFYVSEVHRNENTNELSVTAYDTMYPDAAHTVGNLTLRPPYTYMDFAKAAAKELGARDVTLTGISSTDPSFETILATGVNLDGTITIREALNDLAEATQTIFYIDNYDRLVFKRLGRDREADITINKSDYITLSSKTNRRLSTLVHATELGDNLSATTGVSGTTQYIRDNGFWTAVENLPVLMERAIEIVGNLCINQFDCSWRGNFLLEIGDKIELVTKDFSIVTSFVLDDTVEYNGYFSEKTGWTYNNNEAETEATPTTLGDALNHTYAKVDKINKEISLIVQESDTMKNDMSSLIVNTEGILAEVEYISKKTDNSIDAMNSSIDTLSKKVQAAITSENLSIAIQTELENGINTVTTKTGFTFDEEGLTIDKTGSEMTTKITEDGMTVYRDETEVLTANNVGVQATNLHAKTYLIIGTYSRFEDYINERDEPRTGCFWLGQ